MFLLFLNIILLVGVILGWTKFTLIWAGIIWSGFSVVVEKYVWGYFFRDHLKDRVASEVLVFMIWAGIYIGTYGKLGNICILLAPLACVLYEGWNGYRLKKGNKILYAGVLFIVFSILIFLNIDLIRGYL